ncbi:peptidoglycan-binding protein [Streptomyces sp. NPDC050698]
MEPLNGHPCPECGAPRQRDNTPACACTHRAAEALRDARSAQAAAAEDFDPLRIRPYVEIDGGAPGGTPENGPSPAPGTAQASARDTGPADAARAQGTGPAARNSAAAAHDNASPPRQGTSQTPADAPGEPGAVTASPHTGTPGRAALPGLPADATTPLPPVDPQDPDATAVLPAAAPATAALPTPLPPAATEPSVTDLRLFDDAGGTASGPAEGGRSGGRRPRRRGTLLVAAAGACAAVVAAAGYASGLFSYESPSRDTALPDGIRASVPDAPSSSAASAPARGSASAAPPGPAAPAPSPSRSASPSASPSPSAPSASASPSGSPSPSAPRTSAPATGSGQAPPDSSRQKTGPTVLRLGDRGPEVTELQLRLRQLYLYDDDTDGTFDDRLEEAVRTYQWSRGIQVDELGVYDRETRAKLESETREP